MKRYPLIDGFWERFEEACMRSGMSKDEIARKMGCGRNTLIATSGHCGIHITYLAKFCALTGTSADWLLGLSKERKLKQ